MIYGLIRTLSEWTAPPLSGGRRLWAVWQWRMDERGQACGCDGGWQVEGWQLVKSTRKWAGGDGGSGHGLGAVACERKWSWVQVGTDENLLVCPFTWDRIT
jgi:hypothetical protein